MKQHPQNGWFHSSEFMRASQALWKAATTEHTRWLQFPFMKYVQIRLDQRTGDFIIRDSEGNIVENDVLYAMFPELKD